MLYLLGYNRILRLFVPASGNFNDGEFNDEGSNGNLWSSSLNVDNPNNAWNMNFDSDNLDVNNDNRYNSLPVRGVLAQYLFSFFFYFVMSYILTKDRLLFDLYHAYECAKKHKKSKPYVKSFEKNLHDNLVMLCDELFERRYKPMSSVCFIVKYPKIREIFAANFRDRIVHHLYFNYTHRLYENTFIEDSYACIKGKGTHYGIRRLEQHIRKESQSYAKKCYVLKMDIKGYFIHINRDILLKVTTNVLDKMKFHKTKEGYKWDNVIDFDFIKYLNECIIINNPINDCKFRSSFYEWYELPNSKSMFYSADNCGLPIGNLTSQLLSNVYLNLLDQFMKRCLKCKHYGRYVDDFYVVSCDKHFLKEIIPLVDKFLTSKLDLRLHKGKCKIIDIKQGVEFLGAFIKPYRSYISNTTLNRIRNHLWVFENTYKVTNPYCSINSFLGSFVHYKSYNMRVKCFNISTKIYKYGSFTDDLKKFKSKIC